jgi:hypothetical protein
MKALCRTDSFSFIIEFNDSQTAQEIFQKLPLESTVSTWGQEIYFNIGFKASAEGASMEVEVGDVAYWPQGKSLCVFFGPTPASTTEIPVPASPVVLVGKAKASGQELKQIQLGECIRVEAASE